MIIDDDKLEEVVRNEIRPQVSNKINKICKNKKDDALMSSMLEAEYERQKTKQEKILHALRKTKDNGITNEELSKIALRYGGYLGKLYKEGYKIKKESLGKGLYKYTLIEEPRDKVVIKKAIDKLLLEISKKGKVDKDELVDIMNKCNISVKYKANTYK